jgi:hypothetical protein
MSLNFADVASQAYYTRVFYMPQNITAWGFQLYFPYEERCAEDFLSQLTIHHLGHI